MIQYLFPLILGGAATEAAANGLCAVQDDELIYTNCAGGAVELRLLPEDAGPTPEGALDVTGAYTATDKRDEGRPKPVGLFVRGGEVRLSQVFVNLINNAADAMAGQAERHIRIAIETGPAAVTVTVRDQGPGITAPEKLFEPFYTTKAVGSGEGMGLGLSISYGIIRSFGGELRAANHPGGGAVFTAELIRAKAQEAAA